MKKHLLLIALTIFYIVGIAGHLFAETLPFFLSITPLVLLAFTIIMLVPSVRDDKKMLLWFPITYAATFALEAAGVATGLIFGPYHYGATLGPKFLEVPLIIGANWVIVVLGALRLSERVTARPLLSALIVAALATGFDWVMEPVAIRLDYWTWHTAGIPLQNYAAWFITATIAAYFYRLFKIKTKTILPAWYFIVQLAFFAAIRWF
ncbi:MAG TPA: carotenoid biosynthesis protein [bacterium]|nr:carotenoid biosynthesis protein [bacterium]